jgi:hypothetical protein
MTQNNVKILFKGELLKGQSLFLQLRRIGRKNFKGKKVLRKNRQSSHLNQAAKALFHRHKKTGG